MHDSSPIFFYKICAVVLNLGAILAQGQNFEKNLGAKFEGAEGTLGAKFVVSKAPQSQISECRRHLGAKFQSAESKAVD